MKNLKGWWGNIPLYMYQSHLYLPILALVLKFIALANKNALKLNTLVKSSIISFYHQKTSAPYEKNPCKYNTAHYRC